MLFGVALTDSARVGAAADSVASVARRSSVLASLSGGTVLRGADAALARSASFDSAGRSSGAVGGVLAGEDAAGAAGEDSEGLDAGSAARVGAAVCSSRFSGMLIHTTTATAAVASGTIQPRFDVCHHLRAGTTGAVLAIAARLV